MAGLKQTIFDDNPVAFWSFDEDRAGLEGNQILDEMQNANPLIIHGTKYALETTSLNDIEIADQYALTVAADGCIEDNWGDYNTHFECIHTVDFNFDGYGSFSVEFLYNKPTTTSSNCTFKQYGNPGYGQTMIAPIINKGDMLKIDLTLSATPSIRVRMFGGTRSMSIKSTQYGILDKTSHIVFTYDCWLSDISEYTSRLSLYIDGKLWATDTEVHIDSFPSTSVGESWYLCGDGGGNMLSSYHTSKFKIDQVAIYARALDPEEVSNHYRKTRHYHQIIEDSSPQHYWRLDDVDDVANRTIAAKVGGRNGTYYGQVTRNLAGPERLVESYSVKFELGATGYIQALSGGIVTPIISTNQNYSLEFWFNSQDARRGNLFTVTQEVPEFNGLTVWLNSKDNGHSPGNIQISEDMDTYINSDDVDGTTGERRNWNDGEWHHLVVIRTQDNELKLYIDGGLEASGSFLKQSLNYPGVIHLMGGRPGTTPITGQLSEMAFYTYALSESQIMTRWLFTTQFRVSGYTLLQGQPVSATVRFYDHITGELLSEKKTSLETGEYQFNPQTNRYVDVLSFIPDNKTTRYRVHGPVKPAEFNDSHLI